MARLAIFCLVASLALGASAARHEVSPIQSVLKLLTRLQEQTKKEGQTEAIAYDKFACFCKEQADEKLYSVTTKAEKIALLTAEIKALDSDVQKLNQDIMRSRKEVEEIKKVNEVAKRGRAADHAQYVETHENIQTAVTECKKAIDELEATKAPGQALLQKAVTQVVTALARHDALAHASPMQVKRIQGLAELQLGEGSSRATSPAPEEIIEMLVDLGKTLQGFLNSNDAHEAEAKHAFNLALAARMTQLTSLEKLVSKMEEQATTKEEESKLATEDKTKTTADRDADQTFLDDLTTQCEAKAKAWDERSKTRTAELVSLSGAQKVLKEEVALVENKKLVALSIGKPKVVKAPGHWEWVDDSAVELASSDASADSDADIADDSEEDAEEDADESDAAEDDASDDDAEDGAAEADEEGENDVSFLQRHVRHAHGGVARLRGGRAHRRGGRGVTKKLVKFLTKQAKLLKSSVLSGLVLKMQEDHFVKVRSMIKDMVAKLEQDASEESSQKEWCDEEMAKQLEARDEAVGQIESDNAKIVKTQATIDRKTGDLSVTLKEISTLRKGLNEATELRTGESQENARVVKDAQAGLAGVTKAMKILKDFYENAFVQTGDAYTPPNADASGNTVGDLAPDQAFSGEYKGNQGAVSGILGMLDVIKSDFEKTITETETEESDAETEFNSFQSDADAEITEKESLVKSLRRDKTEQEGTMDDTKGDLKDHLALKTDAYKELAELKPACVDTGSSFNEKVRRRESEIEALQNACDILDQMR